MFLLLYTASMYVQMKGLLSIFVEEHVICQSH